MKRGFAILSVLSMALLPVMLRAQKVDKKTLEYAIVKTINAYQNEDETTLNGLILKDFGIAFLFRRGMFDNIAVYDKISFNYHVPEYLPFNSAVKTDNKVRFEELPVFDCYDEEWNKPPGVYCDTVNTDRTLSKVAKMENEYLNAGWTIDEVKRFEEIENSSHKVIVIGEEHSGEFIFYLTFIGGKWYLTAIDRFEACSA